MSISTQNVQSVVRNDQPAAAPPPEDKGTTTLDRLMATPDTLSRFGQNGRFQEAKAGDTLTSIARENGTTWQTLARINGIANPDRIRVGQQIRLPETTAQTHVVKGGETLSGIAAANGTSVAALARANGIADPNRIGIGQTLHMPTGGAESPVVRSAPQRQAPAARTAPTTTTAPTNATALTNGALTPGVSSIKAADLAASRAAGRASGGKCYAWVKTALQQSGAVKDYMPGVAAKDAGPALEQRGFTNILNQPGANIRSPYDAPKGAVLVYGAAPGATDKNAKYGHIEIRTANGFASDYASANARTGPASNGLEGRGRVLIGVYVKPDAGAATAPQTTGTPQTTATAPQGAYAPQNLSLGANERYRDSIIEASNRTGMTPQTVAAIINAETLKDANGVWQANAKAGTSTATGMTQFLSSTWVGEATRAGSVLNQEAKAAGLVDANNRVVDRAALLEARNDPRLSILAGADYARSNLAALRADGRITDATSPASLAKYAYIAHHEGLAGARGFLDGNMSYLRAGTFDANVRGATATRYLEAAGGDMRQAYRNWLSDYTDRQIDVRHFMANPQGVEVPATRSLFTGGGAR